MITSAKIEGALLNCESLFYVGWNLTSLDLCNLDTTKVTSMHNMFSDCSGLTTLDLSKFDTSNVSHMGGMFRGCSGLTTIDISNWDTSKVTDMTYMFFDCKNLSTIGQVDTASGWHYKPDKYDYMFTNCPATPKLSWYK